jgi:iron-sulfur cluster repair protein YtfE (RIC family)
MLHAIGRKQRSGGDDLVGLLVDCHVRIRTFTALALAVGERSEASYEEIADVCARVERYFIEGMPLHVRDEEESVLPRLRGRSPEIDEALARMHEQHGQHVGPLECMLEASAAIRTAPSDASARSALHEAASRLQAELEPHLQAEESIIFPAIRERLSREEQEAIIGELRARRRV